MTILIKSRKTEHTSKSIQQIVNQLHLSVFRHAPAKIISESDNKTFARARRLSIRTTVFRLPTKCAMFMNVVIVSAGLCYIDKGRPHFVPDKSIADVETLLPRLIQKCKCA